MDLTENKMIKLVVLLTTKTRKMWWKKNAILTRPKITKKRNKPLMKNSRNNLQ